MLKYQHINGSNDGPVVQSVRSLAGADAGLALPYRSQAAPVLPTAERMAALPAGLCRSVALRGCMTRSVVSVADPQPHAALGLPAYVQFTSPIRRYSDLLAHFQVCSSPGRPSQKKKCIPVCAHTLGVNLTSMRGCGTYRQALSSAIPGTTANLAATIVTQGSGLDHGLI